MRDQCKDDELDFLTVLEEINDKWYLRRIEEIKAWPWKFPDWQIHDNRIYIHRKDYLLDPSKWQRQ